MADRDWEKELAEIDRRIASTPDEALAPTAPAARAPGKTAVPAPGRPAPAASTAAPVPAHRRDWKATVGLLFRILLVGVVLAAAVVWPYETRCGGWLAAYLATIGVAALGGIWSAVAAWRHRAAFVHLLSLGVVVTAAVLAAMEVLPRVGYAMPDPAHPAMWVCR